MRSVQFNGLIVYADEGGTREASAGYDGVEVSLTL